jgi:hypothetical protein
MTQALVRTHGYLDEHRAMIVGRAIASAAAGALPIPLVEEWLAALIRRGTIRKIAEDRGVDADPAAIRIVADGPSRAPEWTEIAGAGLISRLLRGTWRRMLIALLVARRAQAASNTFVIGTLFDHYCAKMHVGLGLSAASAAELRALMDEAIRRTPGGVGRQLFRRGVVRALRSTLAAPVDVINLLSRGSLRRLLARGEPVEAEAEAEVDRALEKQLEANDSFLSRATAAVEVQLTAEANPFLNDVIATFEALWREHQRTRSNP